MMCDEALEPLRVVTSDARGRRRARVLLGEFHVYVVSMLFPSAVLARAGGWEDEGFRVSGDWDYVLRAVEHASVRRLDAVVTRYRRHGDSISSSADVAAGAEAGRLVLERYFERHPEQRDTELARRAFARLHLERAGAHAAYGERAGPAARELGAATAAVPLRSLRPRGGGSPVGSGRGQHRPEELRRRRVLHPTLAEDPSGPRGTPTLRRLAGWVAYFRC